MVFFQLVLNYATLHTLDAELQNETVVRLIKIDVEGMGEKVAHARTHARMHASAHAWTRRC